ncbi:MAG: mitochondrial fission ELM1 family protein [Alphaproteobacteria bacterium]
MNDPETPCWVLSDGKAGTENQCIGLAEALDLPFTVLRLRRRRATDWLPAGFWAATGTAALQWSATAPDLHPPWPRVLIAAGRPSVGPAIAIRRAAQGATVTVQIQNPRVAPSHFDRVVAPEHDGLNGANVLTTVGSLHRVTPAALATAASRWADRFRPLPQPRIAVLIGGASKHHRMSVATATRLGAQLRALSSAAGAGLMVTASRRTDRACRDILRAALAGFPVDFWDGTGDNPYTGMLALADGIVVTEDSVSMASEAASTGKPLLIAKLAGGSPKFDRFHETLRQRGISRAFDGQWAPWTYPPLHETARVAAEIRDLLAARFPAGFR